MSPVLRSSAFADGVPIPRAFDHDSGERSPPLQWHGDPDTAAGLVLLEDDPDVPIEGSFVYWVLHGLDPSAAAWPKGKPGGGGGRS